MINLIICVFALLFRGIKVACTPFEHLLNKEVAVVASVGLVIVELIACRMVWCSYGYVREYGWVSIFVFFIAMVVVSLIVRLLCFVVAYFVK